MNTNLEKHSILKESRTYSSTGKSGHIDLHSTRPIPEAQTVKPVSASRTLVITRSSASPLQGSMSMGSSSSMMVRRSYGSCGLGAISAGAISKAVETSVDAIKTERAKEKSDMRELNEKLANYIETTRFNYAQWKKDAADLQKLRENWGKETAKVKEMFIVEMNQLKSIVNQAYKDKSTVDVKLTSTESQLESVLIELKESANLRQSYEEKIVKMNEQLASYEGELTLLRRRLSVAEEVKERDKRDLVRLREEIKRLRIDLDNETVVHINCENSILSLREELDFIKLVHESEMREMAALAIRDTTTENREYWKNEMSMAIREVQQEYDEKIDSIRADIEHSYSVQIEQIHQAANKGGAEVTIIKEETSRLKGKLLEYQKRLPELDAKVISLTQTLEQYRLFSEEKDRQHEAEKIKWTEMMEVSRRDMQILMDQFKELNSLKASLEMEISMYRKLLEGEKSRTNKVGKCGGETIELYERKSVGGYGSGSSHVSGTPGIFGGSSSSLTITTNTVKSQSGSRSRFMRGEIDGLDDLKEVM